MTVAFSGNVINDFPASTGPGVKFLTGGTVNQPIIPADLQPVITTTGFNLEGIALSYDPVSDVLSVGILQPDNGLTSQDVIAGDADNNLNSATESPAVLAIDPLFTDFPDLLSTEGMGVYFDLNADGTPDIIAGINDNPFGTKELQVAQAVVINPAQRPAFGTQLPGFEDNIYLVNSPNHPAMEFSIKNFRQLYQQVIGSPLTTTQPMTAGAFGSPSASTRMSESHYLPQEFNWQEVSPAADLAIRKLDNPDPVRVDGTLVYTVIVNNNGPFANDTVNVSDTIPAGVNVVSITPSQGTVATTPTGFTANLGAIAAGGSASITVVVQPTAIGTVFNTAVVSSGNPWIRDPNPDNNTATTDTTVIGPEFCPPILVNPHRTGVINTAHATLIRVNVFGTDTFDVNNIVADTVNLSGAIPVGDFTQYINGDRIPDRTFLFLGNDPAFASLPAGYTTVVLSGDLTDGSSFHAQSIVFNVNQGNFSAVRARDVEKFVGDLVHEIRATNPPLRLIDTLYPTLATAGKGARGQAIRSMQSMNLADRPALGSSTVRIPGVRAGHSSGLVTVDNGLNYSGVQLGSSTVSIPLTNGKTGPIVIDNASQVSSQTTRRAAARPSRTVAIPQGMTRKAGLGAKVSQSVDDFTLAY
jgi:uncharacterized repeat protein (TIGR01451 family)